MCKIEALLSVKVTLERRSGLTFTPKLLEKNLLTKGSDPLLLQGYNRLQNAL